MSMHKIPLTPLEEEGLYVHGLPRGVPNQRSDTFRQGMAWALKALGQAFAALDGGPTPAVAMPPADASFAFYCDNRAVLNGAPGELKREDEKAADGIPEGDDFNGTTPHMIRCIESLVSMSDRGALAPHGLCGHSRTLLLASVNRLRKQGIDAGMVAVRKDDANNYRRILSLLDMEEEGDPVEAVKELLKSPPQAPVVSEDAAILDWLEMQRVDVRSRIGRRPIFSILSVGDDGKSDLRSKARAVMQPVPQPTPACQDCGKQWDDADKHADLCVAEMLRQETKQAPSVPSEWREIVVLLSDDLTAHLDYCFPNRTTYKRSREQYDHEMRNVYRARSLLYPETQESTSARVSSTDTQTPAKAEIPGVAYWLLERQENGLSWYVNADTGRGSAWHWTTDVNAATRFGRKEDAAAWWNILSRHIGVGGSNTTDTQPSQHIFYPETPQ